MNRKDFASIIIQKLEAERAGILWQWEHPTGTTTRHFVIDDFLRGSIARQIYDAFPKNGEGFNTQESFREKKRTSAQLSRYAPILEEITYAFQDPRVVAKVAEVVGLQKIQPDPGLYAGGLSMMFKGDFLNPHIDNSHDAKRKYYRRLNLLFYVTPGWKMENGGNFELWDERRLVPKTLVSKFNRLVVMETNKTSWHSVSPVVAYGIRCCVSNYYFSEVSPDGGDYFHVTSFDGRPEEAIKRAISSADNTVRNAVSKAFKVGRGKDHMNKEVQGPGK
jgi:Rps23 Pro-64 3,4-dihydroxylase Tpa1-like proline 4-hydroxylase